MRHFLKQFNFHPRKIRVITAPSGKGSAEQFVRKQYAIEVKAYRKRNSSNHRLVVSIDADTTDVTNRSRQLDKELEQAGLTIRQEQEHILLVIPKRNIETWIHYLLGHKNVNEETSYRNQYKGKPEGDHSSPAANKLYDIWIQFKSDQSLPDGLLPSMEIAITDEFIRL
ncbi:MAG: hypothetical protein Tsb009_29480 [Planctomycetaceae bacterium]